MSNSNKITDTTTDFFSNIDDNRMKIQIVYNICLSNLSKKQVRCHVRIGHIHWGNGL